MTLYHEITARVVYKLWVLAVNKSAFSIASQVRFTYLADNAEATYLSICQLLKQRPVETTVPAGTAVTACKADCACNLRWELEGISTRGDPLLNGIASLIEIDETRRD
jgi:hypothetical protein